MTHHVVDYDCIPLSTMPSRVPQIHHFWPQACEVLEIGPKPFHRLQCLASSLSYSNLHPSLRKNEIGIFSGVAIVWVLRVPKYSSLSNKRAAHLILF